jgi:hypothetical protein
MPRWPALGHEKVADRGVPNWADRVARFEGGTYWSSPRLALSGCPLRTFRQMARVFISFIALLCQKLYEIQCYQWVRRNHGVRENLAISTC